MLRKGVSKEKLAEWLADDGDRIAGYVMFTDPYNPPESEQRAAASDLFEQGMLKISAIHTVQCLLVF